MLAIALLLASVVMRSELDRLAGRGEGAYALVMAAGIGGLVGARLTGWRSTLTMHRCSTCSLAQASPGMAACSAARPRCC